MKQGALIYDEQIDRYRIRFGLNEYSEGLSYWDWLEVLIDDKWESTYIGLTLTGKWYLVRIKCKDLNGLIVRH